eukprot:scaffold6932_cov28-Tisochrysis_lutea.AAC.1
MSACPLPAARCRAVVASSSVTKMFAPLSMSLRTSSAHPSSLAARRSAPVPPWRTRTASVGDKPIHVSHPPTRTSIP